MTPGSSYTTARAGEWRRPAGLLVPVCWLIGPIFKLLSQAGCNPRLAEAASVLLVLSLANQAQKVSKL